MDNRSSVNTGKTAAAIQMYDYKSKVFKSKKPAPSLGRQSAGSCAKEDAPTTKTALDVEQCGRRSTVAGGAEGSSLPWYHCPPMGIHHPCFTLGLLIAVVVTLVLLYLFLRVFLFQWLLN